LGSNGYAKRTRGCILVRAEYPYVQLRAAARVTSTEFVLGATNDRKRDELSSLCGLRFRVCFPSSWDWDWPVESSSRKVLDFPFYNSKEKVSHTTERMEREEGEKPKREGGVPEL
jgi:hypothetical protein